MIHPSDRARDLAIILRIEEIKGNKGLTIAEIVGASRKMRLSLQRGRHVTRVIELYPVYFKKRRKSGKTRVYLTNDGREFADAILRLETKLDDLVVQRRTAVSPMLIGAKIIYVSKTLGTKLLRTHYYTMQVSYLDEEGNPTEKWKAFEAVGYIRCVDKEWKEQISIPPKMSEIMNSPRIRMLFKIVLNDFEKAKKKSILVTEHIITILSLYPIIPAQIIDAGEARIIVWKGKQICSKCLSINCMHIKKKSIRTFLQNKR